MDVIQKREDYKEISARSSFLTRIETLKLSKLLQQPTLLEITKVLLLTGEKTSYFAEF